MWKQLSEFPRYEISEDGIIRNIKTKKIKSTFVIRSGYVITRFRVNKQDYTRYVHRLVAITFIPNEHNLPQVNHIDENKQNNNWHNLEWCNATYNLAYGSRNEKIRKKIGKPVRCIETGAEFDTFTAAAKEIGVSPQVFNNYFKGIQKTIKGYHWELIRREIDEV